MRRYGNGRPIHFFPNRGTESPPVPTSRRRRVGDSHEAGVRALETGARPVSPRPG